MNDYKLFFEVCKKGLLNEIEKYFTAPSVDVDAINYNGFTALRIAAKNGRKDVHLPARGWPQIQACLLLQRQ